MIVHEKDKSLIKLWLALIEGVFLELSVEYAVDCFGIRS